MRLCLQSSPTLGPLAAPADICCLPCVPSYCRTPSWSHALQRHSGYTGEALRDCATALANLYRKAPNHSLTAVYKKYSSEKLLQVATMEAPMSLLAEPALE